MNNFHFSCCHYSRIQFRIKLVHTKEFLYVRPKIILASWRKGKLGSTGQSKTGSNQLASLVDHDVPSLGLLMLNLTTDYFFEDGVASKQNYGFKLSSSGKNCSNYELWMEVLWKFLFIFLISQQEKANCSLLLTGNLQRAVGSYHLLTVHTFDRHLYFLTPCQFTLPSCLVVFHNKYQCLLIVISGDQP